MKRLPSLLSRGYTLIELLIAVTLVTVLIALGWLAMEFAATRSRETATVAFIQNVHRGIADYKDDHGHYPRPEREEETGVVQNETFAIGGAKMLYQILSGDGTDAIQNGEEVSTGEPGSAAVGGKDLLAGKIYLSEVQAPTPKMREEKKQAKHVEAGPQGSYFVVDAWRRPLQYHRESQTVDGSRDLKMHSENAFEIWSYGKLKKPLESSDDQKKWLTNWGK